MDTFHAAALTIPQLTKYFLPTATQTKENVIKDFIVKTTDFTKQYYIFNQLITKKNTQK